MASSDRELIERYIQAEADLDWGALQSMRHQDWIEAWPQTGEKIVGNDNWRLVHENFPGYPEIHVSDVVGADASFVMSPAFTLVRISGAGDAWVVQGVGHYGDGSTHHIVKLLELRDGKVHAETTYFAPQSDPPEWRANWVERLDPSDQHQG
jgi:hypothetical protein